jgi:AraC family transcriptional activator of mtrCDE
MDDVLTDWLREIETNAVVLCRSRMPAPWGMKISAREGVMFHIVTEGACWLRRPEADPLRLSEGDLVLLPQGLDHDVVDDPASKAEPLGAFLSKPSFPPNGSPTTTLICGVYLADVELAHPMLLALPTVMHFAARTVQATPPLASTLALLRAEIEAPSPGSEALVQHLFDVLFVYIVRAWTDEGSLERRGWLSALKEPALSKAMARIHAEPAKTWTVETLAREAGLSRAAFARRFAEQVGEPPLSYLTRWRMIVASRLLNSSGASLAEVAERVGYESEFAFSRAFKRSRGVSPARFRQMRCPREAPALT